MNLDIVIRTAQFPPAPDMARGEGGGVSTASLRAKLSRLQIVQLSDRWLTLPINFCFNDGSIFGTCVKPASVI